MSNNILVVGGGISGLAVLHYLKQKFAKRDDISIFLLEKNSHAGGTIQSIRQNGYLFETGPNGFLNNKPRTIEFFESLGLKEDLMEASPEAQFRYISLNNKLYPIPANPKDFLLSPLLNPLEKIRILGEIFIPKGNNPQESIFEFGQRRLGKKFAEVFLDAMAAGIYGGDAREITLKAAFPRIYNLEQEYGSLFKAMFALKNNSASPKGFRIWLRRSKALGMPSGTLTSFRQGMGQCVQVLSQKYKEHIQFNQEVKSISLVQGQCKVESSGQPFLADELFLCCPSYSAARMLENAEPELAQILRKVSYAPIAVIGLTFKLKDFKSRPRGFGFLMPSSENKEVLGVLLDSNIFPQRAPEDKILLRVMLGGARFPDILKKSQEELIQIAFKELQNYFSIKNPPQETFFTAWPKAIPQYDRLYVSLQAELEQQLHALPSLHIVANYWKGISFNDCVENAFQAVEKFSI